ncbi:MAG: ABC transporter ATP-binding protein [Alphaproteobacteria bacterium]|nr:ABC transporter ATP-binding protein [Alphaproteobacteria bacterium]
MKVISQNAFIYMARQAWHYAGAGRGRMLLFYGLFVLANVFIVLQPVVLAHIVNAVQAGGAFMARNALLWCAAYAGTAVGFWAFHGPARIIERRLAFSISRRFITSLYRKVTEMPLRWHQDHHTGDTINRVTKAGKALSTFSQQQFIPIQLAVRFIGSILLLAIYSWWVAVVATALSAGLFLAIRRFDRNLIPLIGVVNEREHRLIAGVFDYIGNIVTVLTLRLQQSTNNEIRHRFLAMRHPYWQEILLNEWKWVVINIVLIFMQAGQVGAYIAVTLWLGKPLVIGTVVAIFQYQMMINQIFFQGSLAAEQILYQRTDVRAVESLLKDHRRLAVVAGEERPRDWKNIRIEGLTFTHNETGDQLEHLRNVNLSIGAGQKIALVGTSGAGKSTLLALLRGLYEIQDAKLIIDSTPYASLKPLAAFTTLVPQDTEIFENTVRYNMTLGIDLPQAALREAMHIAAFGEVAQKLPEGIETDIRERGVNLSGGQKQRLALARGLIAARDSSLLLLDEPTSSVDMETESAIFDRLFAAISGKAIIASVHRLHLLPRFDWICFMRDGEIIQQGSFAELAGAPGPFLTLWQQHLARREAGEE